MELGPEQPRNGAPIAAPRRHSGKATRPQLLTRRELDGRTNAAKYFDQLVVDIENDLAGRDQLSTIERALIEAFAGASVSLQNLNTKLALGQDIDLSQLSQVVGAMVRVATRLGLSRRSRAVDGLTLSDLVRLDDADQQRAKAAKAAVEVVVGDEAAP